MLIEGLLWNHLLECHFRREFLLSPGYILSRIEQTPDSVSLLQF